MKKLNVLLCTLAVAGLTVTSCSSDDDSGNTNDVGIAGTYILEEVNTEETTDLDDDGSFSTNQMNEIDCYDGSRIVLNSDNTFVYDKNRVLVNSTEGTYACSEDTFTGTWVLDGGTGNTAMITANYEDANGQARQLNFNKQGDTITVYEIFSQYPNVNSEGGFYMETGDVEYIYTK